MVRFTLMEGRSSASIRMDLSNEVDLQELSEIASEYWGMENAVFLRGYSLVRGRTVGEVLREGDVIEAIPDPRGTFRSTSFDKALSDGGPWSEDSGHTRTS